MGLGIHSEMRRLAVCAAAFLGVFSVDLNGADGKILGADGNGKFLAIGDIPDYGQTYLSPDFVKPGGGKLFITCRTGDKLLVLEGGKVEKEVLLPQHPSGLAVSPDGKTAWVSIAAPRGELSGRPGGTADGKRAAAGAAGPVRLRTGQAPQLSFTGGNRT